MEIHVGDIYKHSKTGNLYKIVAVAKHSESLEDMVIYEAQYENPLSKIWARPLTSFTEKIILDGREVKRFELIG